MTDAIQNGEVGSSVRAKLNENFVDVSALKAEAALSFDTVAALLADSTLTYTTAPAGTIVEAEGFRYAVAASAATDHHVATAGGVKLYVQAADGAMPQQFGARADNNGAIGNGTDDTAAINKWLSYITTQKKRGLLRGMYRYRPATPWNFDGFSHGLLIQGSGRNFDGFTLDAGFSLNIEAGNGFFYGLDRVHVRGEVDGPVLRLGKDDLTDALNGCDFDLVLNNLSLTANAEALRVNYVLMSRFFVTANCGGTGRPGQPTTPGYGRAFHLRQACFNNFQIAAGQANVGLEFSTGFNFANTFAAIDMEEVAVAIKNTSANTKKNSFVSGQMFGTTTLDFQAGEANTFQGGCNLVNYAGGSLGTNIVGVEIELPAPRSFIISPSPAVPASGVFVKNVTGSKIFVKVWAGTVSDVTLRAVDGGLVGINPQVVGEQTDMIVPPNWEIAITYTVAPAWRWLPA